MEKKKKVGLFRLLEIAGTKKGLLVSSGIFVIIHAVLSIVPYALVYYIVVNLLTTSVDQELTITYINWSVLAVFISLVMIYLSGMASHIAAFNILYELRVKIAEKLGKLPMGYLSQKSSGGLKKILSDDVERIESFVAHGIPDFIKGATLPFIIIVYLFTIDWRLALISFLPLVISVVMVSVVFSSEKTKAVMKAYHEALEEMNAGIVEFVRAMPVMKIFGQSAEAFSKYSRAVEDFDKSTKKWMKKSTPAWAVFMSFISNATLPVLALGLYLHFTQGLTLPVLFLFLILGVGYIRPILALSTLGSQLTMINAGVKRMDEILFDIAEQKEGNLQLKDDFSIVFSDVSFSYNKKYTVLDNVNLEIKKGTITALVGPSGSGKTTMAQLIARFYDIDKGTIKIGGVDIQSIPIKELLNHVSFVFQENHMFYATIKQNITMGKQYAEEDIIAAAKVAHCHDLIQSLPKGYDTHFGDKGVHLSGGEQQRIQLARAVLKDAPILVMDEATAFSDPKNEHEIMQAMGKIIENKTVVIIAHRLSTIAEVDQIVVLDKGKIEGVGLHDELLKTTPLYLNMWLAHNRSKEFEIA